jgi:predicted component of type VI protein secretion system
LIQEEIKWRLNLGNACYHSLQNLLPTRLLFNHSKNRKYKTVILSVVPYGYENLSLTLREERRLRVFENRLLRRIFGPKRDEVTGRHKEELHNL